MLQAQIFSMGQAQGDGSGAGGAGLWESAYRVFAGCPNLVMDLQTDAVLAVFQRDCRIGTSLRCVLQLSLLCIC